MTIEAIADKGYYKGEEIVACEQDGIAVTVSKPHTSNAAADGRFDRADFVYVADDDVYICPAGERLTYRFTNERGRQDAALVLDDCLRDVLRSRASVPQGRSDAFAAGSTRQSLSVFRSGSTTIPAKIPLRSKTVEHPFGTIKAWMGATHFKMKTLKHVATEMALARARLQHDARDGDPRRAAR